jgi:IS1 family transposase
MVKRNRTGHYTYNGQKKKDKPLYIQWSKETGQTIIHTMAKRNRTNHYTYNGQKKQDRPLYIQWSKEKGQTIIHTMVKRMVCPVSFDHCMYNGLSCFF